MKEILKALANDIKNNANSLNDSELLIHFKDGLKDYKVETVKSINSNDFFHIIDNSFVFQIRNNVKFCPIHEVPAKVLLNQKNIKQALIINFLENDIVFKEINK